MNKVIIILLASLFLISSCTQKTPETPKNVECNTDNDCGTAGCSGQLCLQKDNAQDIITTCEYKEEYECLKLTLCSCINNKCQWQENNEYLKCIASTK